VCLTSTSATMSFRTLFFWVHYRCNKNKQFIQKKSVELEQCSSVNAQVLSTDVMMVVTSPTCKQECYEQGIYTVENNSSVATQRHKREMGPWVLWKTGRHSFDPNS